MGQGSWQPWDHLGDNTKQNHLDRPRGSGARLPYTLVLPKGLRHASLTGCSPGQAEIMHKRGQHSAWHMDCTLFSHSSPEYQLSHVGDAEHSSILEND